MDLCEDNVSVGFSSGLKRPLLPIVGFDGKDYPIPSSYGPMPKQATLTANITGSPTQPALVLKAARGDYDNEMAPPAHEASLTFPFGKSESIHFIRKVRIEATAG